MATKQRTSAQICRDNGWPAGTMLVTRDDGERRCIRLTAVGARHVLALELPAMSGMIEDDPCNESVWDLSLREWRQT